MAIPFEADFQHLGQNANVGQTYLLGDGSSSIENTSGVPLRSNVDRQTGFSGLVVFEDGMHIKLPEGAVFGTLLLSIANQDRFECRLLTERNINSVPSPQHVFRLPNSRFRNLYLRLAGIRYIFMHETGNETLLHSIGLFTDT